jgi:mono/diheme cytochrome c family protein
MISRLLLLLSLASPALARDGQQLFSLYCASCHGTDGKGATGGTFPPLADSPWLVGDPDRAVKLILHGLTGPVNVLGQTYNLEMPPQGAVLSDEQIAAILTYTRSAWGNQAGAVSSDAVKSLRAATQDRSTPWTEGELLKLHPLPLEKTALRNLISQSYSGKWSDLPDFSQLTAANIEEEHDGILSLRDSLFEDDFAMLWQASFDAPADGEYEFILDADDAAAVYINGKKIAEIKGAGPMNGSRARKGKVKLTRGSHPFRVEFVEFSDKQGLAVGWKGPGSKGWKWLSEEKSQSPQGRDPIIIQPLDGRPLIYRNFIDGTTPRAIGVAFPGGLNLAWSADHFGPELLWTGTFIDGAKRWIDRGTDANPPAGDDIVNLAKKRTLPAEARFRGYRLDPSGNPTFAIQLGSMILHDAWHAETDTLVRKLTVSGDGAPVEILISDQLSTAAQPDQQILLDGTLLLRSDNAELQTAGSNVTCSLKPGQSTTLTYRWKK